ncbi:hypothetical protein KY336_04530, partial [Candidatus Woesearchaeota archaeon]|nr:hypothetical protein [Candidatus Woesearchaeota archaeon]
PSYHKQIDAAFMYMYDGDIAKVEDFVVAKRYLRRPALEELANEVEALRKSSMAHGKPRKKTMNIEEALKAKEGARPRQRLLRLQKQQEKEISQKFSRSVKSTHIGQVKRTIFKLGTYEILPVLQSMQPIRIYDQKFVNRMNRRLREKGIEIDETGPQDVPDSCEICSGDVSRHSVTLQEVLEDGSFGSGNLYVGQGCAITLFWLFNVREHERKIRQVQKRVKDFKQGKDDEWNEYVMLKDEKQLEAIVSEDVRAKIDEDKKLQLEEDYKLKLLDFLKEVHDLQKDDPDITRILWSMQRSGGYLGFFKDVMDDLEPEELRIYKKMVYGQTLENWEMAIMYHRYANEKRFSKERYAGGIVDDVLYFIENDVVSASAFGQARKAAVLADLTNKKKAGITSNEMKTISKSIKGLLGKRKQEHLKSDARYAGEAIEEILDLFMEYDADRFRDEDSKTLPVNESKLIKEYHGRFVTAQAAVERDPKKKRELVLSNIYSADSIQEHRFMLEEMLTLVRKIRVQREYAEHGPFKDQRKEFLLWEDCREDLGERLGIPELDFYDRPFILINYLAKAMYPKDLAYFSKYSRLRNTLMMPIKELAPGFAAYLEHGLVPKELFNKNNISRLKSMYKIMKEKKFFSIFETTEEDQERTLHNIGLIAKYKQCDWIISLPRLREFLHDIERYTVLRKEEFDKIDDAASALNHLKISDEQAERANELVKKLLEFEDAKVLSLSTTGHVRTFSNYRFTDFNPLESSKRESPRKQGLSRSSELPVLEYYDPKELERKNQQLEGFEIYENKPGRTWLNKLDRLSDDFWKDELLLHNTGFLDAYVEWRKNNPGAKLLVTAEAKEKIEELYEKASRRAAVKRYHDKRRRYALKRIPDLDELASSGDVFDFSELYRKAQEKAQTELARDSGKKINYTRFYHLWQPPVDDGRVIHALSEWRNGRSFGKQEVKLVREFLKKGIEKSYTMRILNLPEWDISRFVRGRRWYGLEKSAERQRSRRYGRKRMPADQRAIWDFMYDVKNEFEERKDDFSSEIYDALMKACDYDSDAAWTMMRKVVSGKRQRFKLPEAVAAEIFSDGFRDDKG